MQQGGLHDQLFNVGVVGVERPVGVAREHPVERQISAGQDRAQRPDPETDTNERQTESEIEPDRRSEQSEAFIAGNRLRSQLKRTLGQDSGRVGELGDRLPDRQGHVAPGGRCGGSLERYEQTIGGDHRRLGHHRFELALVADRQLDTGGARDGREKFDVAAVVDDRHQLGAALHDADTGQVERGVR